MPNRRAEIAMTAEEERAFLEAGRVLVLCSNGPDGVPDPLPMWYVLDPDGHVLMRTWAKSQKVRNLERDPRCSGLVEAGDRYASLRGVQLTGRVELVHDVDLVVDVMAALAEKYEGVTDSAAVREAARGPAAKQVALRLVADQVVSWDHRKLA